MDYSHRMIQVAEKDILDSIAQFDDDTKNDIKHQVSPEMIKQNQMLDTTSLGDSFHEFINVLKALDLGNMPMYVVHDVSPLINHLIAGDRDYTNVLNQMKLVVDHFSQELSGISPDTSHRDAMSILGDLRDVFKASDPDGENCLDGVDDLLYIIEDLLNDPKASKFIDHLINLNTSNSDIYKKDIDKLDDYVQGITSDL